MFLSLEEIKAIAKKVSMNVKVIDLNQENKNSQHILCHTPLGELRMGISYYKQGKYFDFLWFVVKSDEQRVVMSRIYQGIKKELEEKHKIKVLFGTHKVTTSNRLVITGDIEEYIKRVEEQPVPTDEEIRDWYNRVVFKQYDNDQVISDEIIVIGKDATSTLKKLNSTNLIKIYEHSEYRRHVGFPRSDFSTDKKIDDTFNLLKLLGFQVYRNCQPQLYDI